MGKQLGTLHTGHKSFYGSDYQAPGADYSRVPLLPISHTVFVCVCACVRGFLGLTVEEWSGLLGHPTGQHVVGQCQGRAGCLGASVLVLYFPEGCAPAVGGVWHKHIILLIIHSAEIF